MNELDIAEVNLKRAGISAEFGRTSGTVTNAVSRSGSNRFSGIGRIDWLSKDLVGAYELPDDLLDAGVKPGTFRDPLLTTEIGPAVGLGGPIVQDRVFFYGSARYSRETKWDRVNKVGTPLPDEVRTGPEFYGKLTAAPTPSHQLTVSYRHRPSHVDNAGLTSDFAPSVATDDRQRQPDRHARNGRTSSTARSSLNVRYLYMKENNEDVPVTDLGYLPPFNPRNLSAMGQYTDPTQANLTVGANQFTNIQNYRRHEVRGDVHAVLRRRQEQPRAEGRRRLRVRGGDVQPARQRLGHRSPTSRRTACRRCARATTRRSRRSSGRGAPTRCSFRTR